MIYLAGLLLLSVVVVAIGACILAGRADNRANHP
jgi:hypothetical protein